MRMSEELPPVTKGCYLSKPNNRGQACLIKYIEPKELVVNSHNLEFQYYIAGQHSYKL